MVTPSDFSGALGGKGPGRNSGGCGICAVHFPRHGAGSMKDPLASYLHDHLAGATFALELLEALRDQYAASPLGAFAGDLLIEIQKDKIILQRLAESIGAGTSTLKEVASWITEKASRLKLRRQAEVPLGTFETLEALVLGIAGKEALWTTLHHLSRRDRRVEGLDYPALIARAREQQSRAEAQRIQALSTAFSPIES